MRQKLPSLTLLFTLLSPMTANADVQLTGAGSTFVEPIANQWFSDFHNVENKKVQINYQGIGSGAGIKQVIAGTVDFAATDDPMKTDEEKLLPNGVLHVPVVIGAVTLSYNLPTEKALNLDSQVLGEIFLGSIKAWNDPKIQKLNQGVKLPEMAITPVYRSDASGTTAVLTDYLCKVNESFKAGVGFGKAVSWPTGMGGKGNAGVAALINQTPGAIGYVELTYAINNKMKYAAIKNLAGQFVLPTSEGSTAAAQTFLKDMIKSQFKLAITNAPGKESYPISSFSWLVISKKWNAEKGPAMKQVMEYVLSDGAQKTATSLHYAALPKALLQTVKAEVQKVDFGLKVQALTR